MAQKKNFRGNAKLKARDVKIDWTPEMVQEYAKCQNDIFYFIEKYFMIITEEGAVHMEIRPYQRKMINHMMNDRFTLAVMARQSGKTECFRAFLIWYILFNDYKTVGIVANIEKTAMEVISKLQISYALLPKWLQLGITEYNKGSFVLENESRLFASASGKDSLRGFTCQIVVVDEAAHVQNWDEFYGAVSPTISAGKETKLIMASTPKGLNHFYDFYEGSNLKSDTNGWKAIFVPWTEVPGRDENWKRGTLKMLNFDKIKFDQEYNCSFIGSSGTLITGSRLEILRDGVIEPIHEIDRLKIYESPVKSRIEMKQSIESITGPQWSIYEKSVRVENETVMEEVTIPDDKYAIIADVSRGKGLDFSAFSVFNITRVPYRQVATYRNNDITPTDFAHYIYKAAQLYNNALVLVEINDIGEQVGDYLMTELEYDNVLCTCSNGRSGKQITFSVAKADKGVRTTLTLKNSGCLLLKLLLEEGKLLLWDLDTVNELLVFSKDKQTYKAEPGKHDDLAMTLVLFSWLSDQKYFLELTSLNTIGSLSEVSTENIGNKLLNFGYIVKDQEVRNVNDRFAPIYNLNMPFSKIDDQSDYMPTLYLNNF